MKDVTLDTALRELRGIGPRRAADLERARLLTVRDFLTRFPLRYEDRSRLSAIAALAPGTTTSVCGEVIRCGLRRTRRPGYTLFEAVVRDETGTISALWFNQRFLRDVFHPRDRVVLYGKVERKGLAGLQLQNPQYEVVSRADEDAGEAGVSAESPGLHTGRIVPVYERIGTLTPKMQRALAARLLEALDGRTADPLPREVRESLGLPPLQEALRATHFPAEDAGLESLNRFEAPSQVRLVFEEFFSFQVALLLRRRDRARLRKPHRVEVNDGVRAAARAVLPFALTRGQREATREIVGDLRSPHPMNRLLQGDVGAGKTIVALLAALVAMENGLQVAFMAPTEILAAQHYRNLRRLLGRSRHEVALVSAGRGSGERRTVEAAVARGEVGLVVGTHALVEERLAIDRLGLVVVDEQHRFGVMQRATLREKGFCPDVLVMTATPIPRSLALTLYGDLDVSVIRDRPPGRTPVRTTVRSDAGRDEVHAFVRQEISEGRQAYVVYPLVEESEKVDLRAATQMADHLATEVFPDCRVGVLHGRLASDAKDRVMAAFLSRDLDILVTTTVVEVGVDVPNATVMVVEHAERFGLAQLHQLRGRVGRGSHQSYCVLLYQDPLSDDARARLEVLTETEDGFVIAERDLQLRGPGDVFGTRQAGQPWLRIGDPVRDLQIMQRARREAEAWLERAGERDDYAAEARAQWAHRFGLAGVG
jgi:ATP-dependent DNA helicase RecG